MKKQEHLMTMRFGLVLVILLIAHCLSFGESGQIDYNFKIDNNQISYDTISNDGQNSIQIFIDGASYIEEPHNYRLPVVHLKFLVPTYSNNFNVTFEANSQFEKILPYDLYKNGDIYSTNGEKHERDMEFIPPISNVEICDEYFIDGCNHIVCVAFYPVEYKKESMLIKAINNISLQLSYEECEESQMATKPIFPKKKNPLIDLSDIAVNIEPQKTVKIIESLDYSSNPYYIITSNSLKSYFKDLIAWKEGKGHPVKLVTIENILTNPNYKIGVNGNNDAAASLRSYLKDEFVENGSFFCLIAGSKEVMPIRKVKRFEKLISAQNSNYLIPTDNYFSDLTTDWKLEKLSGESIYSAKINTGYHPDIYVGRLICNSKQEIENYLSKLILYESNPGRGDNEYLGKAMFFEQHDVYYDNWHERPEPYEKWDASLIHASRVAREACVSMSVDLIQDRLFTSKQVDGPTSNEIIESMKHHGFNNWYGHGSPYGVKTACYAHILATTKQTLLTHPPFLSHDKSSNLTLEDLKNKDYPSVIYSISCTNMPFDNPIIDSIQFVNNNLAEIFTVNSRNGGPAFLGNTREGWFNVNKLNSLESGASPSLHAAFIRAIEKYNNIGIAEAMSKENCSDNRVKHGHNLIGDPELKIWLTEPHSHSFIETIGDNTLSFNGSSLRSSSIHIYGGKPGKSRSYKINNISPIIQLDNIFHNSIYSYSIWRNGYLPIIKLEAQNLNIKGETLSFVVRTAKLGSTVNRNKTCGDVIVNNNTDLSIRAVDSIDVIDSIIIKQSGKLSLQCDKNISVSGVAVESGGNLDIKGEAVSLGQGFCIKKGASCCIKPN